MNSLHIAQCVHTIITKFKFTWRANVDEISEEESVGVECMLELISSVDKFGEIGSSAIDVCK